MDGVGDRAAAVAVVVVVSYVRLEYRLRAGL